MDLLSSQATNNDAGIPLKTCHTLPRQHTYSYYLTNFFLANFFFRDYFLIDLEALRNLHSAHSKRGAYFCHTHGKGLTCGCPPPDTSLMARTLRPYARYPAY